MERVSERPSLALLRLSWIIRRPTNDIVCAVVSLSGYATRLGLAPSSPTFVSTIRACLHRKSNSVLKLLPCKSLSGIASLLNPHRLFDADWHGMGVHVLWRKEEGIELRLTFRSVSDPLRSSLGKSQGRLQCQISCAYNL